MESNIFQKESSSKQTSKYDKGAERTTFEDNIENLGMDTSNAGKNIPRKFSNNKNLLIAFLGAAIISYMAYYLIINYYGLV